VKIEGGILVRLVDKLPGGFAYSNKLVGSIFTVESLCAAGFFSGRWYLEGVNMVDKSGLRVAYFEGDLIPIPPPEAAEEDFQEDLKRWLNKENTHVANKTRESRTKA